MNLTENLSFTNSERNFLDRVAAIGKKVTVSEYSKKYDIPIDNVYVQFSRATKTGILKKLSRGTYTPGTKSSKRGTNVQDRIRQRFYMLKYRYGLTPQDYQKMFKAQDGRCYLCLLPHLILEVDHNHNTKEIRKLLCHECNVRIAWLENTPGVLSRVVDYLITGSK